MIPGHFVAQIRLVFEPLFTDRSREPDYLAYIEPLQPSNISTSSFGAEPIHIRDESSGLYKVSRLLDEDGSRRGIVINLTDIWRPVDVVPAFGKICPVSWSTDNAVERAKEFYVNHFHDKSSYNDIK